MRLRCSSEKEITFVFQPEDSFQENPLLKTKNLLEQPLFLPLVLILSMTFCTSPYVANAQEDQGAQEETSTLEEKEFHEIYQKSLSEPLSADKWKSAVDSGKAKNYEVQPGDNLWEISEVLFGDPYYWTKIWALNSDSVFNPHEIRKGLRVVFVPGGDEAPQLSIQSNTHTEPTAVAINKETSDSKSATVATQSEFENLVVAIPPTTRKSRPLAKLPNSLPPWSFRGPKDEIIGFDVTRSFDALKTQNSKIPFLLVKEKSNVLGGVIEIEDNSKIAQDGDEVIVHFVKDEMIEKGRRFLVTTYDQSVFDPFQKRGSLEKIISGEVEIVERVDEKRPHYRALIVNSLHPVREGSLLEEGPWPIMPESSKSELSEPPAEYVRVIGGPLNERRRVAGQGSWVYLGGAPKTSLIVGQKYPLFRWSLGRQTHTYIKKNHKRIGEVLIVSSENGFSTGVVVSSSDSIEIGDSLRTE